MNLANLTIKQIEVLFDQEEKSEALLAACASDSRKAVQRLAEKYRKKQQRLQAEQERMNNMLCYERAARQQGFKIIAGADEAGRGPLAGPVSVAAVILPEKFFLPGLNDSKKLSPKKRELLYGEIMEQAICVRQVFVEAEVIDRINILQATIQGMREAIAALQPQPEHILIDALQLKGLPISQEAIIKGDAKSASIAAASVIAKVARDRLMDEYDKIYPQYGFAKHKGYGTAEHVAAIKKYGPCPIHRLTFEPIKGMVAEGHVD